jgi:adenylate cyclase
MNRLSKALTLGLLTSLLGLLISVTPFGALLEENLGLDRLFTLRGARATPLEVALVTLDKESSDIFGLPNQPAKWPRSYHAQLIDNLTQQGARVIAFDLLFEEPRNTADDQRLAQSMRKARNVVLVEALKRETMPQDTGSTITPAMTLERLVPPLPLFSASALATVPFPLPKVPVKVSRFWTFKPGASDAPTLPTTVLQAYALPAYNEFRALLIQANEAYAARLPATPLQDPGLQHLIKTVRELFNQDPALQEKMLGILATSSSANRHLLRALVNMYAGTNHPYLNLYGPPHTVTAIPYHRALSSSQGFKDKAVFVGFSEQRQPEQKDGFYTVFSQDDSGLDISGVEIAATAFANLLENSTVRPVSPAGHLALILLYGLLMGMACRWLPAAFALLASTTLVGGYFAFALYEFSTAAIWLPIAVPLLIQAPAALFTALLWRYIDAIKERRRLRENFGYYVPTNIVDKMSTGNATPGTTGELVHGVCLCTDAEKYTSLSETLPPEQLRTLMNAYYHALFTPVRQHGGMISDVVGDCMLALWTSPTPTTRLHQQACAAALDIETSVAHFNKNLNKPPATLVLPCTSQGSARTATATTLPTRIGMHSGNVMLGNVGAVDHFEYRAVGDIVNTATRIQALNKQLGTKILASHDVLMDINGFLTREMGTFALAGKTQPITVYELMCHEHHATVSQLQIRQRFAEALAAFKDQKWTEAMQGFAATLQLDANDGPAQFYLNLCDSKKNRRRSDKLHGIIPVSR